MEQQTSTIFLLLTAMQVLCFIKKADMKYLIAIPSFMIVYLIIVCIRIDYLIANYPYAHSAPSYAYMLMEYGFPGLLAAICLILLFAAVFRNIRAGRQ